MNTFQKEFKLQNKDVNLFRKLRTSRMFEMMQEITISHTEALGAGRALTLDRGFLWVVLQQYVEILRMPEYDESITFETWPGNTLRVLFPRYCEAKDSNGNVVIRASALWTLIDIQTRSFIFPDQHHIHVPGTTTGKEIELPKAISAKTCTHQTNYIVPYHVCDLNGHMNNARYFDLAEDFITQVKENKQICRIVSEYKSEAAMDDVLLVSWNETDHAAYIQGIGKKECFRMQYDFR